MEEIFCLKKFIRTLTEKKLCTVFLKNYSHAEQNILYYRQAVELHKNFMQKIFTSMLVM